MATTKHTPGPWYRYNPHRRTKGNGIVICTDQRQERLFGDNSEFSAPFIVCQPGLYSSVDLNSEELTANCCLIAAAPDLLEALKALMPIVKHFIKNQDFDGIVNAEAAIAKATNPELSK